MSQTRVVPLWALGVPLDVRVGGEGAAAQALAEGIRRRWHLCLRDGAEVETTPVRVVDVALRESDSPAARPASPRGASVVEDSDERRLLQRLTQSVTHALIEARTGDLLMLHAAAVADPTTGASAVFVAPGNTGKTTLCRTLAPGRGYLTDETVGIRRDGGIDAYPKPLSLRREDWLGVKDETAPADVGLAAATAAPWVAGLVLLQRDAAHEGPPEVEELDLLDAVLALTPESSGFMGTDGPLRWVAEVLDRTGPARRLRYAEVSDLEPLTAEILARSSPW